MMAGRLEPVFRGSSICSLRRVVREDDSQRAVGAQLGAVMIHGNRVVTVVERLHPVIVDLEIPIIATRRRDLEEESFVIGQLPIAVIVANVRIPMRGTGDG